MIYILPILSAFVSFGLLIAPIYLNKKQLISLGSYKLPALVTGMTVILWGCLFILGGFTVKAICLLPLVIAIVSTLTISSFFLCKLSSTLATLLVYAILMLLLLPASIQLLMRLENMHEILLALLQTNIAEMTSFSKDLISDYKTEGILLVGLLISLFLTLRHVTRGAFTRTYINPYYLVILLISAYIPLIFAEDMTSRVFPRFHDSDGLLGTTDLYIEQIRKARAMEKELPAIIKTNADAKDYTLVVVIGESLSRNFLSSYGYPAVTNPYLSERIAAEPILQFQNTYAAAYVTRIIVPMMLSSLNQYRENEYALSIFQLLRRAGIKSYWLSSQHKAGVYDAAVSMMADQADYSQYASAHEIQFDERLIATFREKLETEGPKVIFLHLWGQHKRAEDAYPHRAPFLRDTTYEYSNQFHYDNSVVYNDYVVDQFIRTLDSVSDNNAFIYLSDHGDIPGKLRLKEYVDYAMLRIPMWIRFSPKYAKENKARVQQLTRNIDKFWSNDLFFELLLGLTGMTDPAFYRPEWDLSSEKYEMEIENLKSVEWLKIKDDPYLEKPKETTETSTFTPQD